MLERLEKAVIAGGVPITGIDASGNVTPVELQQAAQPFIDAFDWSQAAHDAWLEDQQPERKSLRQAAVNAIADNDAFIADANVTQAEAVAQVKKLSQQMNRVIRRLVQLS